MSLAAASMHAPRAGHSSRSAIVLPDDEAQLMWMPRGELRRVTRMGFRDFMLARRHPAPRPDVIRSTKTADHYVRLVRQMLRAAGHDVPRYERLAAPPAEKLAQQAKISHKMALLFLGPRNDWEEIAPNPEAIYEFTWGGHPRFAAHRKACLWWFAYWGVTGPQLPAFLRDEWDRVEDVSLAKAAGEMRSRTLKLDLPEEFALLAGAHPYEDMLVEKSGGAYYARGDARRRARLEDAIWRCAIHTEFYMLRRPQDMEALQLRHFVNGRIMGLEQGKKSQLPIDPSVPESWVLNDPGDNAPSLRWFLDKIRPQIPNAPTTPNSPILCRPDGSAWPPGAFRDFLSDGIRYVLGHDLGPHALRRGGATWRAHNGWSPGRVARLLGDTERVARATYIDEDWIISQGRSLAIGDRAPMVPQIRPRRGAVRGKVEKRADKDGVMRWVIVPRGAE